MMNLPKLLLMLLLLAAVSFADADEGGFVKYVKNVSSSFSDAALEPFVSSGQATGTGISEGVKALFASFQTASCEPAIIRDDPIAIISAWLGPAMIAIVGICFALGAIYIFGQFMSMPNLIALAKDEGYQTVITVIRVLFVAATIYAGTVWYSLATHSSTDPVYKDSKDMLDAAMSYSRLMTFRISENYSALIIYNMLVHILYTATMYVGTNFRSMYNFHMGPVLKPFIDLVGVGLQFLSLALGEWVAHLITLCFIKKWAWAFFIPVGILLRALPPTRDVGEAIFMLVMALGTIYPFMFMVNYEIHKLVEPNMADPMMTIQAIASNIGITKIATVALALTMFGGGGAVLVPVLIGSLTMGAFNLMKVATYYIIIISIFLPFLNIFITLTLAREWARVFNVNVNYMSFLRIL